jgi:hypothetical protein
MLYTWLWYLQYSLLYVSLDRADRDTLTVRLEAMRQLRAARSQCTKRWFDRCSIPCDTWLASWMICVTESCGGCGFLLPAPEALDEFPPLPTPRVASRNCFRSPCDQDNALHSQTTDYLWDSSLFITMFTETHTGHHPEPVYSKTWLIWNSRDQKKRFFFSIKKNLYNLT